MSKHEGNSHAEDSDHYGCILAMLSAAAAADLPRKEPPPPAAPVGKAPIGKYPVGKAPIGKYPQPVAAQGLSVANTGGQRDTDRCSSAASFASAFG